MDAYEEMLAARRGEGEKMENNKLEKLAECAFVNTRNGMGFAEPTWQDLAEETRQMYRDWMIKRGSIDAHNITLTSGAHTAPETE